MSYQSEFGVRFVDHITWPDGIDWSPDQDDPTTVAGDVIAYLLHWVEASEGDPLEAIELARLHFEAEQGDGDDLCQMSDHLDELLRD